MEELTIQQAQSRMAAGDLTARQLAEMYLTRIAEIDQAGPRLNSVIEINPDALEIADALDAESAWRRGPRGPLHGIPILIKDNIDTHDRMQTTAGSLALAGHIAAHDADRRREAARGRRSDPGQDQPQRMGQLSLDALHQRLEQPRRADAQSLRARPQSVRLQLRVGRGRGREPVRGRRGHGDGRLDHLPVERQRHRRHQAHAGPGQPCGHHPHRPQPGHRRPDGAHGRRRGDSACRARRPRSPRSDHHERIWDTDGADDAEADLA